MNCRHLMIIIVACLFAQPVLAQSQIPPETAVRFAGKAAMVCGNVESAKVASNTEGQPTFLHMGAAFPRHTFSVKILGANVGKWPSAPDGLVGQLICVSGTIKRAGATRAEMELDDPSQMKLGVSK